MDISQIHLCDAGTGHLKSLVSHVAECPECQRQFLLSVKAFPFASLLFGPEPTKTLNRLNDSLKGNGNG